MGCGFFEELLGSGQRAIEHGENGVFLDLREVLSGFDLLIELL